MRSFASRSLARVALASIAFGVGACGAGADADASSHPRQVVLVLLDAARADRLSCYGYAKETTPNVDALAAAGAVCERHYTQGTNTRRSLPCLLYSRYFTVPVFPFSDKVPLERPDDLFRTIDDACISFPEVFRRAGFLTAGISAHSWTRPDSAFARTFDEWYDLSATTLVDKELGYPEADVVVGRALEWIEAHRDEDFLLYVHLMDTHFPHFFGEDARAFLDGEPPPLDKFRPTGIPDDHDVALDERELAYLDALYDGSMRLTDRALGPLIDRMVALGALEHGALAITSDHGEMLMEHGVFGHGVPAYEQVARIPLVLAGHGVPAGMRVGLPTGTVDILPTFAGRMGIALPEGKVPDGVDALANEGRDLAERGMLGIDGGFVEKSYKLVLRDRADVVFSGRAPGRLRGFLVDLARDPGESNLAESSGLLDGPGEPLFAAAVKRYRERMGPLYRRFVESRANVTPEGPFAIGAWSFDVSRECASGPKHGAELLEDASYRDGWALSSQWPDFYLAGHGSAEPLTVEFAVPDGEYEVELQLFGACEVRLDPRESFASVATAAFDGQRASASDHVALGDVRIDAQRFRATFRPNPAGDWFVLHGIGFTPAGAAGVDEDAERARTERLEALGYIGE